MSEKPSATKPISALRRRMLEDMAVRKFGEKSRHDYIRHVETFAKFLGRSPDTATAEDLRRYQVHQTETDVGPPSINSAASALRFFFTITAGRAELAHQLARAHYPRKLPRILAPEEVARLLEAAPGPGLKYKAALSIAYGAGLRGGEVVMLRVGDIDSKRMLIRVEMGKGRKDRHAMLSPQLLELLRAWWRQSRSQGWSVSRPGSASAADRASTQSRLPHGGCGSGPRRMGHAAHAQTLLRDAPAGKRHRRARDPGALRNGDILPANNRLKHASPTDFILASARAYASGGGSSEAAPRLLSCTNLTAPSRAFQCG